MTALAIATLWLFNTINWALANFTASKHSICPTVGNAAMLTYVYSICAAVCVATRGSWMFSVLIWVMAEFLAKFIASKLSICGTVGKTVMLAYVFSTCAGGCVATRGAWIFSVLIWAVAAFSSGISSTLTDLVECVSLSTEVIVAGITSKRQKN